MLKPMIRTIDRWRFELPLALALGAAVAFATIAAPHELFGAAPGVEATGRQIVLQDVVAVVLALFATSIAYLATRRPSASGPMADIDDDDDDWLDSEDDAEAEAKKIKAAKAEVKTSAPKVEVADSEPAEPQIRLRRADAHPDAPPRAPIRASRDLGEPFMDIDGFAPPPLAPLVVPPKLPPFIDADFKKIETPAARAVEQAPVAETPAMPAPVSEPVPPLVAQVVPVEEIQPESSMPATPVAPVDPVATEPVVEPVPVAAPAPVAEIEPEIVPPVAIEPAILAQPAAPAPIVEPPVAETSAVVEPSPIEAFEPEADATPVPVRPARQPLAAMMERLSSGLERRNGQPLAPPPASAVAEALSAPRDMKPELRNALDELNRLARRD